MGRVYCKVHEDQPLMAWRSRRISETTTTASTKTSTQRTIWKEVLSRNLAVLPRHLENKVTYRVRIHKGVCVLIAAFSIANGSRDGIIVHLHTKYMVKINGSRLTNCVRRRHGRHKTSTGSVEPCSAIDKCTSYGWICKRRCEKL
jgi:hypothetical protein